MYYSYYFSVIANSLPLCIRYCGIAHISQYPPTSSKHLNEIVLVWKVGIYAMFANVTILVSLSNSCTVISIAL